MTSGSWFNCRGAHKAPLQFLVLFAALLLVGCEKHITPNQVPAPVQKAFAVKYPGATDVEWEQEDSKIEAEFTFNGKSIEAEFNPDGTFLEEE